MPSGSVHRYIGSVGPFNGRRMLLHRFQKTGKKREKGPRRGGWWNQGIEKKTSNGIERLPPAHQFTLQPLDAGFGRGYRMSTKDGSANGETGTYVHYGTPRVNYIPRVYECVRAYMMRGDGNGRNRHRIRRPRWPTPPASSPPRLGFSPALGPIAFETGPRVARMKWKAGGS